MKNSLAAYLDRKGLSRADFAARINVSPVSVHRYIAGDRFPARDVLMAIERETLGEVTASSFLFEADEAPAA